MTMVRCTLHLYLPAGWELGEGSQADPDTLRRLGGSLRERCALAADAVAALTTRGWRCRVRRHDVTAEKDCDRATAMLDFLRADLDPVALGLRECDGLAASAAGLPPPAPAGAGRPRAAGPAAQTVKGPGIPGPSPR
jgi:hypothetical protein